MHGSDGAGRSQGAVFHGGCSRAMSWLPPSSEGKQLFGIGIITVMLTLVLLGAWHYMAALRVHNETDIRNQASVLASSLANVDAATASKIIASVDGRMVSLGGPLEAVLVQGERGTVLASGTPDDVGKPYETAEARIHSRWSSAALGKAPAGENTLYVFAPSSNASEAASRLSVAFAASLLLGLLFIPFFFLLNRSYVAPVHRLAEANRAALGKPGNIVPAASFPPGDLRDVVTHRNQVLETLKVKEEALGRRTSDMEALYEYSQKVGLSREAPDIPDLALTFLSRSVDYDMAAMLVFTDMQRSLNMRSRGPISEMLAADVERLAVDAHYEKSGILLEGEKLDTAHSIADVRAAKLDGKFKSLHWAPITVERKQVGILGFMALPDKHFSTDAVRFLNILAQNTSLALEKLHVMRIEETQRFRNVLEHLAEGVVLVRQGGDWALATGPTREFHAIICGPDAAGTTEHSRQCPIGLLGLDVFHSQNSITREIARDERTFILNGTFVRSSTAGEQGAVISIRDVTEERTTQQQLFQASKLASLGELAAGVAHEVNNPLTGILGFTELLMSREDISPETYESLQDIHALARRTAQITMDLLIFARVQREGGFQPVDLRGVVDDTIKLLETGYRNLNLELVAEMGNGETPLYAVGDQNKIQQIVLNLAQNAKDAITMSGKGSRIVFRGYRQKEEMVVEVEDDGPGIPDRVRAKIFEPFFTTKPVGKGTGLGLAIVNRIVEEHKGKLVVDSDEGRGTRFRITLPAATAEAIAKMPPPTVDPRQRAAPPVPRGAAARASVREGDELLQPPRPSSPTEAPAEVGKGTVLVLDDEDTVLKFVTRTLERDGLVVHSTSDPEEAMALIGEHQPDLLLLDFRMPDMTGEELYRQVVDSNPSWANRVVFLTGDATGDEIQGFLKQTGAPALTKPIGIRDLRDFVQKKLAEVRGVPPVV